MLTNQDLHALIAQLTQRNLFLATAESCTGGLIAATLTDIPGSSDWFERGFVTYSNLSKAQMLGVSADLIAQHGAVSEQVASAMALGAQHRSRAKVTLSVTGVAGPSGGTETKPVGMVCFGWCVNDDPVITATQYFSGDRQGIRAQAVRFALMELTRILR